MANKKRNNQKHLRFLAQSVILEEAGVSQFVRIGVIICCLGIVGFIGWAAITPIAEVAVAKGEVVPTGSVLVVQHLEGGIVESISVREAERVVAGQPLITLRGDSAAGELKQMRSRRAALRLRSKRLRTVAEGGQFDPGNVEPEFQDLARDQMIIFNTQTRARESQREVLQKQIKQRETEIEIMRDQAAGLKEQITIVAEEYSLRKQLFKKGLSPKLTVLEVSRELKRLESELIQIRSQTKQAISAASETEGRVVELDTRLNNEAAVEMGTAMAQLAEVEEAIGKLEDRVRRLVIRSPADGLAKGLTANTVGGVVEPGRTLLEIVPMDKGLVLEAQLSTRDIGHLSIGQPTRIKFSNYDFARYGFLEGNVASISATTFEDDEGKPYYMTTISLERSYLGENAEINPILPGMIAQADIFTGERSILEYLLKPIYRSVEQAMRER